VLSFNKNFCEKFSSFAKFLLKESNAYSHIEINSSLLSNYRTKKDALGQTSKRGQF